MSRVGGWAGALGEKRRARERAAAGISEMKGDASGPPISESLARWPPIAEAIGRLVGAYNAGAEGSIVVAKVKEMKQDEGFNAATEVYEDLVKAGVIDPAKVVRNALQNAASIASLLLTTEALVSEIPEEKKEAAGGGHGMPGGGIGGMY